jgi:hypothetical protein
VQVTRHHLAPIRRLPCLVDSFRREAAHVARANVPGRTEPTGPGWQAVRVAYAIRWIELSTGAALPAWQAWAPSDAARD